MARGSGPVQIGRYEIRRELGRGVMGVVYQAWDPALGRAIALKTIKPVAASRAERESWERRFLIEARAAARLSHPAIVVVHDVGRDPESEILYIALEYLKGETLAETIAGGRPLPWREALRILARVAEGLDHAHAQGVVHRDVKPANIMLLPSGEPKILDFGVARLDAGSLTHPGDLCGTPLYMSPEQAVGQTLDARSDIFSLGAVAWALLTGHSPFEASSLSAILARVTHRCPPPPSEITPGIPAEVDAILARAMAKRPEDRYENGRALAEDVEDVLAGRPPRHGAEWEAPQAAERTRVSARPRDAAPALELLDEQAPATPARVPRRRRAWFRLALLLALLAAAGAYFQLHPEDATLWNLLSRRAASRLGTALLVHGQGPSAAPPRPTGTVPTVSPPPSPSPSAPSTPEDPATEPPPEATAADRGNEPAVAEPPGPAGGAPGATEPEALETGATDAPPSPSPPSATPAARSGHGKTGRTGTAFLSIGFEHGLKSGTLEVWVDGARVAQEKLDSRVSKKALLFEVRKGSVQQTLRLSPGRHELRVRISADGATRSARTTADFRAGATRRLELRISRLSQKLSLDWK